MGWFQGWLACALLLIIPLPHSRCVQKAATGVSQPSAGGRAEDAA